MAMTDNEITDALREKYGVEHQTMILIEEMSELTKELVKSYRGYKNRNAIAEETADVLFMIKQLIRNLDLQDDVDAWGEQKRKKVQCELINCIDDADGLIKELDEIFKDFTRKEDME